MTTIPFAQTWKQARAAKRVQRRTPALVALASWLARTLPTWKGARTAVMQWAGAGSICYGLFTVSLLAGAIAVGVSLFVLEALGGER